MEATAIAPRSSTTRIAFGTLALLLLAAIVVEIARHGTGVWQLAAFGLGPDLALLLGAAAGLEKGQLHPRAVPLYNILHRPWLPLALLTLASFGFVPRGYLVGGLAWLLHIGVDRAVGYGLRTRDGFQRA
jgi:hypothetical protein